MEWWTTHCRCNFPKPILQGKNPATWDGGEEHGYSVSIICETHVAKRSQLKLKDDFRVGVNKDNNDLPVESNMAQRYRIQRDDKIDLKRTQSSFQMTLNWIKQSKYLVEKMMLKIFRLVSMILIWHLKIS